jgi:hypothetical protein
MTMSKPEVKPPRPGWIEVGRETASYLRAAGLDGVAVENVPPNNYSGPAFAPAWAEAICSVTNVSQRLKMCALKKAARDPSVAQIVTTLVCCIDPADRKELVEQLGQEFAQTLVCVCGKKFESATEWRDHVEFSCKARNKAIDKL